MMKIRKIIDISMPVFEGMQVYKGNPSPKITRINSIAGSSSNISLISMGSHCGTHIDMPSHISNKGTNSSGFKTQSAMGECFVADFTKIGMEIRLPDIKKIKLKKGQILLLKTRNSMARGGKFKTDFIYLSEEAAKHLVKAGIRAIGTDALSIDKYHSGTHPNHHAFINAGISIIEGLRLQKATQGIFTLICLPLKIAGVDGLPARAILIKD